MDQIKVLETKVKELQLQVATISLLLVSMQTQMKQMDTTMNTKNVADTKDEAVEKKVPFESHSSDLSIDDSESDGYTSDDDECDHQQASGVNQYVMISNYCDSLDLDSDDSEITSDQSESILEEL